MEPNPYIKPLAQRATGYGYIVEKDTYKLRYINPPLVQKLGQEEEEMHGKFCYETIFKHTSPCTFCRMYKTPLEESTSWYLHHEETMSHYVMCGFLTRKDDGDYFVQMLTGITEEIEEIETLKASISAEQMVTACANTLKKGADSIEDLLEILCEFYQGSYAYLFLRDSKTMTSHLDYIYSKKDLTQAFENLKKQYFPLKEDSTWSDLFKEKEYIYLEGADLDQNHFPMASQFIQDEPTTAFFLTDIVVNGKLLGLLGMHNSKVNFEHFNRISTVKSFIANSLAMKEQIQTLQTQNDLAHVVLNCVATLEGKNTYDQAIEELLSVVADYFQGDRVYILKKEVGSQGLAMEYEYVVPPNHPSDQGVLVASLAVINQWFELYGKNDTLVISSVSEQLTIETQSNYELSLLKSDGVESFLGVRLFEQGVLKRFLIVDNPKIRTEQVKLLKSISSFVESHLAKGKLLKQLEELSYMDSLTGLYNRNFYSNYTDYLSSTEAKNIGVVFADVNGLKRANDNFGHEFGDILLKWSGKFLKEQLGSMIFRIGGDEFVCFLEDVTEDSFQEKIQTLKDKMGEVIHISLGCQWTAQFQIDIMKEVDQKMYLEKKKYYQEKAKDKRSVREELEDFKASILSLKEE